MTEFRIKKHPILDVPERKEIKFSWSGKKLTGFEGETISSALIANGIRIFGHHHKDNSPMGIFCANGQCSQCMVLVDGKPLKSCMELLRPGMKIEPLNGLPELPVVKAKPPKLVEQRTVETTVLILGGGPAGLSAAEELGKRNVPCILVDDKHKLGGKLVLQTHRFFGSTQAVFAGTRGINIASKLEKEVRKHSSIEIWLNSTGLAVFSDHRVGILKDAKDYILVDPQIILVTTGAREKFLAFNGNALPGVFGAGAFQTLVNRDLVKPSEKLFIVGGGNVGLIAGYHALQAGIQVVGLVEATPECGGYKVHKDKLVRMGVPIYTSHTILSANGNANVESVTIAAVDQHFKPISGTEKSFECDSVLIAVGLDPIDEFYKKAVQYGYKAFIAGDAEEIAEASAAIFAGKIKGMEIARELGVESNPVPLEWYRTSEILKSRPGSIFIEEKPELESGVVPVIHCTQEIPCDPCSGLCSHGLIFIDKKDIRSVPSFLGNSYCCEVCEKCVAGCPGLAITLVNYRENPEMPSVSIPYEFTRETIRIGDWVTVQDTEGKALGTVEVESVHTIQNNDKTWIIQVAAPKEIAQRIAGIKVQDDRQIHPLDHYVAHIEDDTIVCRCEHVTAGEIRKMIRAGYRDMNEIKTVSRAGMGSCGGKTCASLIIRIFREEGVSQEEITEYTKRPLFMEVPIGQLAGEENE